MRTTFGQVKLPIGKVLNMLSTDSRVLDYVNRAQERLLYEGAFKDTLVRYAVCVNGSCLVWPRALETIEAAAVCQRPIQLRNAFYEFLENGPGTLDSTSSLALTLVDRGNVLTFDQPVGGANKRLAIYADGAEAAGTVLLRFYDANANKVYSTYGGSVIEGVRLSIPSAGGYTVASQSLLRGGLYAVIKPVTKYQIRLYEYDTVALTHLPLAYYEPDETVPEYRASVIPALNTQGSGDCTTQLVEVVGKIRFIPAVSDDSILTIPHVDAVRLAVQAVKKEEDNMLDDAAKYWAAAIAALDKQLKHWKGSGNSVPIRIAPANVWGGGVPNII